MYTQCPECQTAFRVTATILQQAGGQVRCGGCGSSFSALENLSEELPPAPQEKATGKGKELLDSLDKLAGTEEVRIEDTGIEWRVMDDDKDEPPAEAADRGGSSTGRWYIDGEDGATDPAATEANVPEISDTVDPAAAGAQAHPDEMRFDDNTPLPEGFAGDVHAPPATLQRRQSDQELTERADFDELQVDLALSEPDDWMDLLDEVDESAAAGTGNIPLEVEEELAAIHSELATPRQEPAIDPDETADLPIMPSAPADLDSQFGLQAEAMGLELDEERQDVVPESEQPEIEETDAAQNSLESTGEFEQQIAVAQKALHQRYADDEETASADGEPASAEQEAAAELSREVESSLAPEAAGEAAADLPPDDGDHARPATGEARLTIDEQIDQELQAAAKERDFATTMIEDPESLFDENSPEVETIIMEGEAIRGSFELEPQAPEKKAAGDIDSPGPLLDTYALSRGKVRGGRRKTDPPSFGMIAAASLLAILLLGQFIHASRQALSTYGAFNQTLGPVYRVMGMPVTPEWNVKGWRFEATNGATDENEEVLNIFSRIVNRATQALPYPLVHVSLTDRWEEIIGSRILEPNEYLAGDLDPSRPVMPGDSFTAVISIDDPSADATGFKLNVCYRVSPGRVRCATEDFKD